MRNLFYIVAVALEIIWSIGVFGFAAGSIIHLLLLIALIAVILKVVRGKPIV